MVLLAHSGTLLTVVQVAITLKVALPVAALVVLVAAALVVLVVLTALMVEVAAVTVKEQPHESLESLTERYTPVVALVLIEMVALVAVEIPIAIAIVTEKLTQAVAAVASIQGYIPAELAQAAAALSSCASIRRWRHELRTDHKRRCEQHHLAL